MSKLRTLETLQFDNTFARLPEVFYAKVTPTPLKNPCLVAFNPEAAALLDLDPKEARRPEFAGCFAGQYLPPGSEPLAMVYAGHQFGAYVSRLGDGRAILLGEVRNGRGEKWDLHLKGAGLTPFSRDDDGRAVLRSCIREYLCGEAMHGLGIATTRALCVVGSEEEVLREQVETGATLLRLAPSHVRFGHFEFFYWRRQFDHLKTLADYVLAQHFPELVGRPDAYARFYHDAAIQAGLDAYEAVFAEHYGELMRAKLGLREARPGDDTLLRDLLELMRGSDTDYTNVFRALCDFKETPEARNETIRDHFVDREAFDKWAERYKARLWAEGSRDEGGREAERAARMKRVNPKYVLRNYLAHTAIRMATEQKDFSEIERLRLLLRDPFAEQPEMDRYAAPPPDWGKHLIVSCSS